LNSVQTVFIVDDDHKIRHSLTSQVRSLELETEAFDSAKEYLKTFDPMRSGCLLLEDRSPGSHAGHHAHTSVGMSGIELLEHINNQAVFMPAIIISAHIEVPTVVRAMRAGARDFLQKPCRDQSLRQAIQECFQWDVANRRRLVQATKITRRMEQLSPGEYLVLENIAEGKSNKDIAADLNVSMRTIEVRRAKLMRKMKANSLAELIKMIMSIEIIGGIKKIGDNQQ
jgi:two-component system, LuxR family, response regulator FixJ